MILRSKGPGHMAHSSLQGQKRKAPAAYLMSSVTVPSVCRSKGQSHQTDDLHIVAVSVATNF